MQLPQQRYVSDLYWAFESPDLLAALPAPIHNGIPFAAFTTFSAHSVVPKPQQTSSLQKEFNFIPPNNYRLGHYFEQLVVQGLEHYGQAANLRANQQVIVKQQTLGEFDVLLQDSPRAAWTHIELATKFYLKIGAGDQLSDWVGPNLTDRFDTKYDRLLEHQVHLSQRDEVQPWLKAQAIEIQQRAVLCKGRLFYPWNDFLKQEFCHPTQVAPDHLKGFWMLLEELMGYLANGSVHFYALPKSYWLSEIQEDDLAELILLDVENCLDVCSERLVQIIQWDGAREVARGFVVVDEWLIKARQRITIES